MSARVLALPQPLACQEVAGRVATTDQEATADLVLDVAIKAAVAALTSDVGTRAYRAARAELLLATAGASADRILGRGPR